MMNRQKKKQRREREAIHETDEVESFNIGVYQSSSGPPSRAESTVSSGEIVIQDLSDSEQSGSSTMLPTKKLADDTHIIKTQPDLPSPQESLENASAVAKETGNGSNNHQSDDECMKKAARIKACKDRTKYQSLFDAAGVKFSTGKDECDCLEEDCPGCHFPCVKCFSMKCGTECRANRRWTYESIDGFETMSQAERGNVFEVVPEKPKPIEIVTIDD